MTRKKPLTWYPFFVVDYRRDTYHLTLEEDAAYRRLIDEYMVTREALPNDDAALARIVGIPKTDWTRLAIKVRRFFHARNDKLWHKRCELELREQSARHNLLANAGKKGGMTTALKRNGLVSHAAARLQPRSSTLQRKKEDTIREIEEGVVDKSVDNSGQTAEKRSSEEARDEAIRGMRARRKGTG